MELTRRSSQDDPAVLSGRLAAQVQWVAVFSNRTQVVDMVICSAGQWRDVCLSYVVSRQSLVLRVRELATCGCIWVEWVDAQEIIQARDTSLVRM